MILSFSGCTTSPSASRPVSDALHRVDDIIDKEACKIDERFLVECKWMVKARDDSDPEILRTNNKNAQLYTECYVLHNKFVKQYKDEDSE